MPNSPWILMDSQFFFGRRYDLFVHLPTECGENCLIWKVYIHKECARKQWPYLTLRLVLSHENQRISPGKPPCVGLFSVSDVENPCLEGQSREDRLEAGAPFFDRSTKINPKKTGPWFFADIFGRFWKFDSMYPVGFKLMWPKKNRKEDSESQKLSENPKAQPWNPEFTACVPRFFSAQDQCLGLGQIMLLHAHATNVASLSEKELIVAGLGWCFWVIYPLVI